jgi:hypothetical protein
MINARGATDDHPLITLEYSITTPVARRAIAMMRLRLLGATRCASRAPYHAARACAGATDAHTARSILPSRIGPEMPGANAATNGHDPCRNADAQEHWARGSRGCGGQPAGHDQCFIADDMLERIPLASRVGKTLVGGIDLCSSEHQQIARAWLSVGTPVQESVPTSDHGAPPLTEYPRVVGLITTGLRAASTSDLYAPIASANLSAPRTRFLPI